MQTLFEMIRNFDKLYYCAQEFAALPCRRFIGLVSLQVNVDGSVLSGKQVLPRD